jgi:hypothetical protein
MKPLTANIISILIYFIAAAISLNFINTVTFHILGIAFIIAGAFGIVSLFKTGNFLFK